MYYKDVELFKSQAVVDRVRTTTCHPMVSCLLDDLSHPAGRRPRRNAWCRACRSTCRTWTPISFAFHSIVNKQMQRASSKGLVCGSRLTIHLVGGDVVGVNDTEGTLVPAGEDIAHFDVDDELAWVLIVEKEVCVCDPLVLFRCMPTDLAGRLSNALPTQLRKSPQLTRARTYYYRVYLLPRRTGVSLTAIRNRARGTPMWPRAN